MIEHTTKRATSVRIAQAHGHHAVVELTGGSAILTLDACRLGAAFGKACFVDQADRLITSMGFRDQLLQAIQSPLVIPGVRGQKVLKGSRGHARCVGHRLNTLPADVGKLTPDVPLEMITPLTAGEAVVE